MQADDGIFGVCRTVGTLKNKGVFQLTVNEIKKIRGGISQQLVSNCAEEACVAPCAATLH